jgi:SH3 domain-containing YSC84-like protein 1
MTSENKQALTAETPNYYDHTPALSVFSDHRPDPEKPVEQSSPVPTQPLKSRSTLGRRFHRVAVMAGLPLNKAANLIGSEGWWPSSMDKECDKAARILYSFTGKLKDHHESIQWKPGR